MSWLWKPKKEYHCSRCGHDWHGRLDPEPKRCAKCRSPLWNAPRRYQVRGLKKGTKLLGRSGSYTARSGGFKVPYDT